LDILNEKMIMTGSNVV